MLTAVIARFRSPDGWLQGLPAQGRTLDRGFRRAIRRRVHFPDGRPEFHLADLLPWRRSAAPEPIQIVERPVSTVPPSQVVAHALHALLGDASKRAVAEVDRHLESIPRGRERAGKFPSLVVAHALRTERVVETELRREARATRQSVAPVDYRARLEGEARALGAEIALERHAESFAPLTEEELSVRQGQLLLVRLLLDMDDSRADLQRRRRVAIPGAAPTAGSDDGGNLASQPRQRGAGIEIEL